MSCHSSLGVLIADDDNKRTRSDNVSGLSYYRSWQTDWHFGCKIQHLVDTVHDTQSYHSRMVQLADIFVYACQLHQRDNLPYVKQQVYDHAVKQGLYSAATYKYWPTKMSTWYQASQKTESAEDASSQSNPPKLRSASNLPNPSRSLQPGDLGR